MACVSESVTATLCGHNEFEDALADPPIEASVPPKKYLVETTKDDLSVSIVYDGAITPCHGIVTTTITASGETKVDSYSAEDCVLTTGDWSGDGLASGTKIFNFSWLCPPDADPPNCPDYEGGECVILSEGPATFDIEDHADARGYKVVSTTREETNAFSFDSGSINKTLSSEDTEADALARAEDSTEGASCTAIREERVDGFAFNYTTVKYEAILTGLIPGFYYDGVVPTEKRAAVRGETYEDSDWSGGTSIEIPQFRASKVFQLIGGGTLNVPDDDFIDENYSLDPLDYPGTFPVDGIGDLVDPDAKVITPVTELIAESGEARRLLNPKITKWWSETERDRP